MESNGGGRSPVADRTISPDHDEINDDNNSDNQINKSTKDAPWVISMTVVVV